MVAPPGPVSAEALRFALVRPPEGACTTTWVSTVSPRAPDKLMEEAVPGASACPTLIRLDSTHTGNGEVDDWLAAIKIVRMTNTAAANGRLFARRKVQRACPPSWSEELESIFMNLLLQQLIFELGKN